MRKLKKNKNNNLLYFSSIVIVIAIMFLSVGFSAFQNNLAIENISSTVRIDKDIRVMNNSINRLMKQLVIMKSIMLQIFLEVLN